MTSLILIFLYQILSRHCQLGWMMIIPQSNYSRIHHFQRPLYYQMIIKCQAFHQWEKSLIQPTPQTREGNWLQCGGGCSPRIAYEIPSWRSMQTFFKNLILNVVRFLHFVLGIESLLPIYDGGNKSTLLILVHSIPKWCSVVFSLYNMEIRVVLQLE